MDHCIIKYPRTPHLEGSRLQPGDEDLSQIPFADISGRQIVVEEKCDGANTAVSFDSNGNLLLQSRGRYLSGGWGERHYNLFKQWARTHAQAFYQVLGARYIMYGEWMYAKHTVFYDRLPHYFLEFDILDRETGIFFDTKARRELLRELPVVSVPVLAAGTFTQREALLAKLGPSRYISADPKASFLASCAKEGLEAQKQRFEGSTVMEGLYLKIEEDGQVKRRLKFVRPSFCQQAQAADDHWQSRPIVPNLLAVPAAEMFLPALSRRDD